MTKGILDATIKIFNKLQIISCNSIYIESEKIINLKQNIEDKFASHGIPDGDDSDNCIFTVLKNR